jgi:hypothetical protein
MKYTLEQALKDAIDQSPKFNFVQLSGEGVEVAKKAMELYANRRVEELEKEKQKLKASIEEEIERLKVELQYCQNIIKGVLSGSTTPDIIEAQIHKIQKLINPHP